jgi:hypothetical protein
MNRHIPALDIGMSVRQLAARVEYRLSMLLTIVGL